jgi:hypothetical protein
MRNETPMTGDELALIENAVRRISALECVLATVGVYQDFAFYKKHLERIEEYLRNSLFDEMMYLSLAYTGVTWYPKIEYQFWGIEFYEWSRSFSRNDIPPTGLKRLMALSKAVDGWWHCPSEHVREFVTLKAWEVLFQTNLHR